ncbi:hypothetical protein [Aquimarina algicola]|uniref:Uncharacterized protein n=1 Tax=Aquimarina algicola TaxID=2589995 RepID=A0A504IWK0_9FLAO|nr:hypothetical protein [Aquimarina algicola]TPN82756.1 hypothetical protein FHK87_20220 [Aquimarina algicola]
MNQFEKTAVIMKYFFVSFLFLTLAITTVSCSETSVEEEIGLDEIDIDKKPKTYLIDKDEVQPPIDRD